MMEVMTILRILLIAQDKEEKRVVNKNNHLKATLKTLDKMKKLHNLLLRMMIVHHFLQATGLCN